MAEAKSVNDQIHEDLIPHDIDLRRVDAHCRRKIEDRLDQLVADLAALAVKVDPHGASRNDARQRRLSKLEKESRALVREAYRDVNKMCMSDMQRIAVVEQEKQISSLESNIP
jgi:hypothetical protein